MKCLLCEKPIAWQDYLVKGAICEECFINQGGEDADSK